MSLYVSGKYILVTKPIDFVEDETLELVPYDSKNRRILKDLPSLIRVVVSNHQFYDSRFHLVELAAV